METKIIAALWALCLENDAGRQYYVPKIVGYLCKNPAVARIADLAGCQWPSRASKIDDFHFV